LTVHSIVSLSSNKYAASIAVDGFRQVVNPPSITIGSFNPCHGFPTDERHRRILRFHSQRCAVVHRHKAGRPGFDRFRATMLRAYHGCSLSRHRTAERCAKPHFDLIEEIDGLKNIPVSLCPPGRMGEKVAIQPAIPDDHCLAPMKYNRVVYNFLLSIQMVESVIY
jgi:hypothetical protein